MSATINANDMKFTIFGSGNDYTLVNSGVGNMRFFSHPFVPLYSYNSAGQYLLYAPVYNPSDETAEPTIQDVVMNDISHCTFDPPLQTAFTTEGEVEIKIAYHRQYVYDDTIINVDKELTQKITVVDHGLRTSSDWYLDVYTDGYCFVRAPLAYIAQPDNYRNENNRTFTKISSIPWRATGIYQLAAGSGLVDISELEYADTSNLRNMREAFAGCNLVDLTPIANWDVSKVTNFNSTFRNNQHLVDLTPLSGWDLSSVTSMEYTFANCCDIIDLTPLKHWNVSNVVTMQGMFEMNVSPYDADEVPLIKSLDGLEDWDVSKVTSFEAMFRYMRWLDDISALANWDTSKVTTFAYMFAADNISDISPLNDWDFSHATTMSGMFSSSSIRHSSALNKDVYDLQYWNYYIDDEGNQYPDADVGTVTTISRSASDASNWNVILTGANAFTAYSSVSSGWTNIPSWN